MAGAVRFTTVELTEMERKISEAESKALALELQLFADLVKDIMARLPDLRRAAKPWQNRRCRRAGASG
jgi:DNA mismatch repair protein MutS